MPANDGRRGEHRGLGPASESLQRTKLRQPAVSQQLARLRADDLVETRRDGKSVYYSLARPEVRDVIMALHAAFCPPKRSR